MAFWLLLLMVTACAAFVSHEDLSGKKINFPEETNTAYVTLTPNKQSLSAITVCLRFMSDLSRKHILFSLATSTHHNGFTIFNRGTRDRIDVLVQNDRTKFRGQDYKLNTWHSVCSTWDSVSGLLQLWFDGKSTIKKYVDGLTISNPTIVLGQDQDKVGGGFATGQSFVGMICDVHVWNSVLSPCGIMRFMKKQYFTPGNVVNWKALQYTKNGRVELEDKKKVCPRHYPFHYPIHHYPIRHY